MDKIGIFSFFSGAGFLDLGFEKTGKYDILFVNEFHKAFDYVYRYSRRRMGIAEPRYGHNVGDIAEYLQPERESELRTQIVEAHQDYPLIGFIGGPPCPDFSVAGKNKGKDGENGKLSGTYCQLICNLKPDFFLFENVKGLYRTKRHREFFESLKRKFKRNGYSLVEQLINSIEFGAPQDRDRIILIGIRKDVADKLNIPYKGDSLLNFDWDKHKVISREEVAEINWPKTSPYVENSIKPCPNDVPKELTIQYWWDKNDVEHHPNENMYFQPRAGLRRFQTIEEGDDHKKSYKRLNRWRYSPTAAYGNNEVHIHPYKPRRISVAEALAIQSLPKEYVIPQDISLTDAFKTVGNGVPYLAAKGVALDIYDYLNINNK